MLWDSAAGERRKDILATSGSRGVGTSAVSTQLVDDDERVTKLLSPLFFVSDVGSALSNWRCMRK